ncbi:MAG TPA: alpha/beta hydrolase [Dehalococcoidia bacterium]|nr:alpha/beta hydrolase [Dehalococcoidia bacterium]
MPEVEVNGATFHYEASGSGEPLLLLHGGGGTALLHFRREIARLSQRYRVIAPDMRGYGASSPPRLFEGDFYGQDGRDAAALLEALDAVPAHLCGWSDGSVVALIVAADRPELVRTLCVWGAEGRILPHERGLWRNVSNWQAWPESTRERYARAQGPLNWPGLLERMVSGYGRVLDAGGMIVADRLHRVRCPTLILHGDEDDVVPVAHAYELHRLIRGSELRIFHGAGHALHREHHVELMETITSFIARQQDAGAGAGELESIPGG